MKIFTPFFFICITVLVNAQVGPAGICDLDSDDLLFWFSPEHNITDSSGYVSSWRSRATYLTEPSDGLPGILLKQTDSNKRPVFSDGLKGRSNYLEFDGINDLIESENFSDAINSDLSVLVVFQFTALDTSHSAIFSGHKTSSNYSWQLAYKGGSVRVYNGFSSSTNIKIENSPDGRWHLYYMEIADGVLSVYLDGEYIDNESPISSEMYKFYNITLGQNRESNIYSEGKLGDVMGFGRKLTDFERIRLFNSMSAKYDIGLAYQDYFDEGLTSEFGLNVVGAGQYNGESFTEVRGENGLNVKLNTGVEDGEMLFVGQSNLSVDNAFENKPDNLVERLAPTFAIDEDGHIGSVTFSVDSSIVENALGGEIKLVVSSDTVFTDSDTEYTMTLSEGKYSADVDFTANSVSYLMVGALSMPLYLSIIDFDATYDPFHKGNKVSWSIDSNGDPYEMILERSSNLKDWSEIGRFEVNCNGVCRDNYIDQEKELGDVYYRMKSEGLDGDISYSSLKLVASEQTWIRNAFYPNPNNGKVYFYHKKTGKLKIRTPEGKLVLQKQLLNKNRVNLEELEAGLYFLELESVDEPVIYQRLLIQH